MDLDELSNEQLKALAEGAPVESVVKPPEPTNTVDLDSLSNDELSLLATGKTTMEQLMENKQPGMLSRAGSAVMSGIGAVGETIDKYTGDASTRSAIGALQQGKSPMSAFVSQFSKDPSQAPTGKEIAVDAGFSPVQQEAKVARGFLARPETVKGPSPAGMVGLGIDVLASPTNLIPGVAVARAGIKGTVGAGKLIGKGTLKAGKLAGKGALKLTDMATGGGATKFAEFSEKAAGGAADTIKTLFRPTQNADFPILKQVAEKNGIGINPETGIFDADLLPEQVEFGKTSIISRIAKAITEGPTGEARLKKFENAVNEVQSALTRKFSQLSNNTSALDQSAAGRVVRDNLDNGVENFFNNISVKYAELPNFQRGLPIPDEVMVPLEKSIEKVIKGADKVAGTGVGANIRTQARQLSEEGVRILERLQQNPTLDNMVETWQELGKFLFQRPKSLADVPPDIKQFRQLYFDLGDALNNTTAAHFGEEIAQDILVNNIAITEFLKNKSGVAKLMTDGAVPEHRVLSQILSDPEKITAYRNVTNNSPEAINQLKAQFLDSLSNENIEGFLSYRSIFNNLERKKHIASALFEPQELAEIVDIIKLGDAMGIPVLSTSGTGASNAFKTILQGIQSSVLNEGVIGKLKAAARQAGASAKEADKLVDAVKVANKRKFNLPRIGEGLKSAIKPDFGKLDRRTPVERFLKGAQVKSVQDQNEDKQRALQRRLQRSN